MIVHLNGMPGVGKYTIAKLLAAQIGARLVDNHLLIDLVTVFCEHGSSEYILMLRRLTDVVFEQIEKSPTEIFIFTNALSTERPEDRKRLDYLANFAKNKNIPFVQVLLICDVEENKRRIISDDRRLKGKLIDPDELDVICGKYTIYHPPVEFAFNLDTTHLSAKAAAEQVKKFVENIK